VSRLENTFVIYDNKGYPGIKTSPQNKFQMYGLGMYTKLCEGQVKFYKECVSFNPHKKERPAKLFKRQKEKFMQQFRNVVKIKKVNGGLTWSGKVDAEGREQAGRNDDFVIAAGISWVVGYNLAYTGMTMKSGLGMFHISTFIRIPSNL